MGQGSDTLDDCGACQADDDFRHEEAERLFIAARTAEGKYKVAKSATVGSTIHCPCCNKAITKATYHKVFCSNQRTHSKGNCKDKYWNLIQRVATEQDRLNSVW